MKKLEMQLFGTFFLSDGKTVLDEKTLHSKKLTQLLVYILMNRHSVLTHQKLIEVFWDGSSKNPEAALKNQIYLIRNALKELGPEEYLCTVPGAYRWNPEIEVETDYEVFEEIANTIKENELETQEKIRLCRKLISCYKGNVFKKISDEPWILPKVIWFQSVYMDTVKVLCGLLAEQKEWEEIEMICSQVLQMDPLDEDIHCWLLYSLSGQKKYDKALNHYEKANKQFYESIGVQNPEKLRATFKEILSETENSAMDMDHLINEIREKNTPQGVFFCDYQIFRQIYQMESRRIDRIGAAEHIILFTLKIRGNEMAVDKLLMKGMEELETSIRSSLRTGDVASRYSKTQFIVLLPMCSYESAAKVVMRIQKNFQRTFGKSSLELSYELAELLTSV